jgi:hypothetical protein
MFRCLGDELPFLTTNRDTAPQARVVVVEDPLATDKFIPRLDRIQAMVDRGMTNLTGKATPAQAWLSLLTTQDVVGLKVYSDPGPNSGTRPAVVQAVIQELIAAGLSRTNIVIWDKSSTSLRLAGYYKLADRLGVRIASSIRAGYDPTNYYDTPLIGNLTWGDLEFDRKGEGIGRKSFVSKLVARELTKIINITPLLNNNLAGVAGNLYGLAMDSVDNTMRFENDSSRLARAVPEIYALPSVGDRVVLNIVDALICQYEGGEYSMLHYSAVLNQLRFSKDPVALDVLSIKELERQRQLAGFVEIKPDLEIYANAALLQLGVADLSMVKVDTLHQSSEGQDGNPTPLP